MFLDKIMGEHRLFIKRNERKTKKINILWLAVVVLIIYLSWLFLLNLTVNSFGVNREDLGQLGDSFGSLNALFSGFALAGVVYAIILQSKELSLQREELEETRQVLRSQQKEFNEQNKTLRLQRFENTFFQMLSLHNETLNSIIIRQRDGNNITGREALESFFRNLFHKVNEECKKNPNAIVQDIMIQQYNNFYKQNQSKVGHYFNNVFKILNLISQAKEVHNKQMYAEFLKAQISSIEIALIFYHCLGARASVERGFKDLIEEYGLFQNIRSSDIQDMRNSLLQYNGSAYGNDYPSEVRG